MFRKVSETSDEKYERIIVSEDERGNRCTCYFPRHTPEEREKLDERVRGAMRHFVNACIEKHGYEWARERLAVKEQE